MTELNFDDLEQKINDAFYDEVLSPRIDKLIDFFVRVQENKKTHQLLKSGKRPEALDIIYTAYDPLSYIRANPCLEFYGYDSHAQDLEYHSDAYSHLVIDEMVERVVRENLPAQEIEDPFYPETYWENQWQLEYIGIRACWQKACQITGTSIPAFLCAHDGGGGIYELTEGVEIDSIQLINPIEKYLAGKGIHPEKFLDEEDIPIEFPAPESGKFWKKIRALFTSKPKN